MIITQLLIINNYFLGEVRYDIENEASITMDSLLIEDLGADSLDSIDIVMSIEDEFKIEVPDEVIENINSVADIVNFIENNM